MAGIYCADIYCDDCIEDIKRRIIGDLMRQEGLILTSLCDPTDFEEKYGFDDEREYDSGEYPKGCSDDEESDSPEHCGSHEDCLDPTVLSDGRKVGHCFGNSLTSYGVDYVKQAVRDGGPVAELWREVYDWIDFDEDEDKPEEGDFTITPTGRLGGKSGLGRFEVGFIGEFDSDDEAISYAKRLMTVEQFWPNIWIVSDHGNWELYSDED